MSGGALKQRQNRASLDTEAEVSLRVHVTTGDQRLPETAPHPGREVVPVGGVGEHAGACGDRKTSNCLKIM